MMALIGYLTVIFGGAYLIGSFVAAVIVTCRRSRDPIEDLVIGLYAGALAGVIWMAGVIALAHF